MNSCKNKFFLLLLILEGLNGDIHTKKKNKIILAKGSRIDDEFLCICMASFTVLNTSAFLCIAYV